MLRWIHVRWSRRENRAGLGFGPWAQGTSSTSWPIWLRVLGELARNTWRRQLHQCFQTWVKCRSSAIWLGVSFQLFSLTARRFMSVPPSIGHLKILFPSISFEWQGVISLSSNATSPTSTWQGNLLPEFGSLPWALKPLLVLLIERSCSAKARQQLLAMAAIITGLTWLLLSLSLWTSLNSVRTPLFSKLSVSLGYKKERSCCTLRLRSFRLRSWDGKDGTVLLFATALVSLGSAVVDGLTDGLISAESTEASAVELQSLCQTGHSIGQAADDVERFTRQRYDTARRQLFQQRGGQLFKHAV